jgi:hypothetical protein
LTRAEKGRIFISYRRDDSAGYAGRIFDRLSAHFGKDAIFMDVSAIEAGLDFVDVLENAVQSCDVLVALIGRQWLTLKDSFEKRRLDNPEDFVRIEIAAALKRKIRVLPVLVDGVNMPNSTELPSGLKSLARRNAVPVTHYAFDSDTHRLISQLEIALEATEKFKRLKEKEIEERQTHTQYQAEIERLLVQADTALSLKDWVLAQEKLNSILNLDDDHAQAQVKLEFARRKISEALVFRLR